MFENIIIRSPQPMPKPGMTNARLRCYLQGIECPLKAPVHGEFCAKSLQGFLKRVVVNACWAPLRQILNRGPSRALPVLLAECPKPMQY